MDEGRKIPGYQGYIPGKNNHVIGKRYTEAAARAIECTSMLRSNGDPNGMVELVDDRPQGRHFLYAQTANPDTRIYTTPDTMAEADPSTKATTIGGPVPKTLTASLPALSYAKKKMVFKKETKEELPADVTTSGYLPGYTGHKHGSQHVFAKSYGSTTKLLSGDDGLDTQQQSKKLLPYGEERPCGQALTEKHRIPGYQGYIPGNHNHIYGKTYGEATTLAPLAEETMKSGGNASALNDLVDSRPQGKINLYAQAADLNPEEPRMPLNVNKSKGVVNVQYYDVGKDYKRRLKIPDDTKEAMLGTHRVKGYTGHVHGSQHMYAASYGKVTRSLCNNLTEPHTSHGLLFYKDDRPHVPRQ